MPRMSSEARDRRRRQFIDAARRSASNGGYRNLTIDDVCAEAGLSKGAFYVHFETKEELLVALLDDDAAAMDELLETSSLDNVGALRRFLSAAIAHGEDPSTFQLRVDLWAEVLIDPALRDRFVAALSERRQTLARAIEHAITAGGLVDAPANALAAIMLALADGLTLHHALDPSGFRWQNVRRALNVILEGLDPNRA